MPSGLLRRTSLDRLPRHAAADAAGRLKEFLALLGKELTQAEVAHFDETGGRVKGKLW